MSVISICSAVCLIIVMDTLLSVDNLLVLAAMVSHLPVAQRRRALRAGLLGAYLTRLLGLVSASMLAASPCLKIFGGFYLILLMLRHLQGKEAAQAKASSVVRSFWATVVTVEFTDMVFSIDNVLATVAINRSLFIILFGTCISIAALRLISGFFLGLIENFPSLKQAAYLLVGATGANLLIEQSTGFDAPALLKFAFAITVVGIAMIQDQRKKCSARVLHDTPTLVIQDAK